MRERRISPALLLLLAACQHANLSVLPEESGWVLLEPTPQRPASATAMHSGPCGDAPQTGCLFLTWSAPTRQVRPAPLTFVCPGGTNVSTHPPLWLVHVGKGWGAKTDGPPPAAGWRLAVKSPGAQCVTVDGALPSLTLGSLCTSLEGPRRPLSCAVEGRSQPR